MSDDHYDRGHIRTVNEGLMQVLEESSVPSPKSLQFRCVQNGPPARREEGAYLNGYVTDEQRSRRAIFNATLWTVSGWLFFRVARSLHIDLDMLVARALEKQPTGLRRNLRDLGDGTLGLKEA